ncbi:hypothetical protein DPMN_045428 [Dreissena polymorpha]|uniref:Uncharacterized protein n=1 Tax=Dreissena polymorpha TaxID=45954 RepID=A0A9D4D667_DREPO|nr:hypothetical protein DPMN_045428 [Dreissena polymorpha]
MLNDDDLMLEDGGMQYVFAHMNRRKHIDKYILSEARSGSGMRAKALKLNSMKAALKKNAFVEKSVLLN